MICCLVVWMMVAYSLNAPSVFDHLVSMVLRPRCFDDDVLCHFGEGGRYSVV